MNEGKVVRIITTKLGCVTPGDEGVIEQDLGCGYSVAIAARLGDKQPRETSLYFAKDEVEIIELELDKYL
jgi:hypothetical protein